MTTASNSASVQIAGAGMTTFGRHRDRSVADLAAEAVHAAVADAALSLSDIDVAFYANTTQSPLEGQHMIGGQIALRRLGLGGIPIFNVENACASGTSAFHLAVAHVRAGLADVALAVGAEKMNVGDRARAMAVFDGAYDTSRPETLAETLVELGGDIDDSTIGQRSVFMDIYAAVARAHMREFGTTEEQIAAVAAKNHLHAVHNERAFYRAEMTVREVLAARPLAPPLTVPMCAPLTDGAAAVVVGSAEALRNLGVPDPVDVMASVVVSGQDRDLGDWNRHVTRVAGRAAYEQAGVGPGDVDVAEVHDATAFAEILVSEMLGLCEPGSGGMAAASGVTTIGGRIPVNPSGGLESKGHPLAATGLGQIFELVEQLRGRAGVRQVTDARIGLTENGGGFLGYEEAVAAVTILGRIDS
ncbi:conserved hypothetical protein [Rhodococcus sp. RD6.2]|uniref:thiolase family protein n=1 Tax=Rhodococcus sp. RD6.2 TaxID=260936 RepID=UPI00063B4825|nr:thiolase family protein [Rhodococcus sp. RD6.2]CRK52816.1 conserved hypothetical protein [Rhodococcus sp. RD6.2]